MGGHGALTLGLRNPQLYKSISAFSPICNPIQVPWGQKAFSGYLGDNQEEWKQYDATELVSSGLQDQFYRAARTCAPVTGLRLSLLPAVCLVCMAGHLQVFNVLLTSFGSLEAGSEL